MIGNVHTEDDDVKVGEDNGVCEAGIDFENPIVETKCFTPNTAPSVQHAPLPHLAFDLEMVSN